MLMNTDMNVKKKKRWMRTKPMMIWVHVWDKIRGDATIFLCGVEMF